VNDAITLQEAAQLCRVSTKTIRRHIAAGRLPAYRLGDRHIRIHRNDLESLMRPIPAAR